MKSAFISPIVPYRPTRVLTKMSFSSHPVYDVAAVSTYIAYWTAGYWKGENRRDVEFVAIVLGIIWHFAMSHDPSIYYYLWLMGGASHFFREKQLAENKVEDANQSQVGVQLGGYMAFFLMVMDLLDVAFGY